MLTPKQEKFVQGIVEGKSQCGAYKEAYNVSKMTDKSIHEAASRLMSDSKVRARVEELRAKIDDELIMSAKERARRLTEFIHDQDPSVALKAIDLLNKMTGEYTQKVEAAVSRDIEVNITLEE